MKETLEVTRALLARAEEEKEMPLTAEIAKTPADVILEGGHVVAEDFKATAVGDVWVQGAGSGRLVIRGRGMSRKGWHDETSRDTLSPRDCGWACPHLRTSMRSSRRSKTSIYRLSTESP